MTPSDPRPSPGSDGGRAWPAWLAGLAAKLYLLGVLVFLDPLIRLSRLLGPRALRRLSALQCRLLHGTVPLASCRLRIEGTEHLDRDRRFLVVSNHQSMMESILPLSVLAPIDPVFICKKELGRGIPSVSFTLRRGDHCLIDRDDRVQAVAAIEAVGARALRGEVSPVLFPEGTRSPDGRPLPFRRTGFRTLLAACPGIPVLPVIIEGGRHVLPKGSFRNANPGRTVVLKIYPPIDREGLADEALIDRVEELFHTEIPRLQGTRPEVLAPSPSPSPGGA